MKRLVSIILFGIAGCTAGPNFSQPEVTIAANWANSPTGQPVDARWWEGFADPALTRLIEQALATNLTIEAALARVDQAAAAARASGARRLPAAEADAAAARTVQSQNAGLGQLSRIVPGFPRSADFASASVGASWDLDFAGGLRRSQEASEARLAEAEAGVFAARNAIIGELADAYVSLRAAEAQMVQLDRLIAIQVDRATIMAARLRVGTVPATALSVSRAAVAEAQAMRVALDAQVAADRARIAALTGQSASTLSGLGNDTGEQLTAPTDLAAGIPGDVIRNRPDVRMAEARMIAANAAIGIAMAEYYPRVSLSGLLGLQSNSFGSVLTGDSVTGQGVLGLRWRLFDFGRIDAEVAGARGQLRETLALYRLAVLTAAAEIETAFGGLFAMRARWRAIGRQRSEAVRQLNAATIAYRRGQISRDAALEAEAGLIAIDVLLQQAHGDLLRATVAAHRALGVPIKPEPARAGP